MGNARNKPRGTSWSAAMLPTSPPSLLTGRNNDCRISSLYTVLSKSGERYNGNEGNYLRPLILCKVSRSWRPSQLTLGRRWGSPRTSRQYCTSQEHIERQATDHACSQFRFIHSPIIHVCGGRRNQGESRHRANPTQNRPN